MRPGPASCDFGGSSVCGGRSGTVVRAWLTSPRNGAALIKNSLGMRSSRVNERSSGRNGRKVRPACTASRRRMSMRVAPSLSTTARGATPRVCERRGKLRCLHARHQTSGLATLAGGDSPATAPADQLTGTGAHTSSISQLFRSDRTLVVSPSSPGYCRRATVQPATCSKRRSRQT